jgi:general secretion pathway protein G
MKVPVLARASCAKRVRGICAFTLIELLVVIAILAVLASLLLPVLSSARSKARQSKCRSNLRQVGLAIQMYADDSEGWMPMTTHETADTNQSWIFTLRPYLANVDAVRICPADPKGHARLTNGASSYLLNEYVAVDEADHSGEVIESYRNLNQLRAPAETHTVFTCSDSVKPIALSDHIHSRDWVKNGAGDWPAVTSDIAPDRHRSGPSSPDHTQGSANYLFADAHVSSIRAIEFKRRIDRGDNPALPP